MPLTSGRSERASVATQLVWSSIGFALAIALALGAAHWYVLPTTNGAVGRSIWTERDFVCTAASSALALTLAVFGRRAALGVGATAARSAVARAALWLGFTLIFEVIWLDWVSLFSLLIAPTHAFAAVRLLGLWSRWRSDVLWSRKP